jgi:hypothetical protein
MRLSFAADVYPLGVMVSLLLEADLVGDVRVFRAPNLGGGTEDHKVLYDPTPFVGEDSNVIAPEAVPSWTLFVEECLRFDPKRRLSGASEFAERLSELIEQYPPLGFVDIAASEMPLIAATLPDSSESVARVILDEHQGEADDFSWQQ